MNGYSMGPGVAKSPTQQPRRPRQRAVFTCKHADSAGLEARGATDQAGRVLQRVKAIYRWAVTHQRIDTNPMFDLVPSEILKPLTC